MLLVLSVVTTDLVVVADERFLRKDVIIIVRVCSFSCSV